MSRGWARGVVAALAMCIVIPWAGPRADELPLNRIRLPEDREP